MRIELFSLARPAFYSPMSPSPTPAVHDFGSDRSRGLLPGPVPVETDEAPEFLLEGARLAT